MTESRINAFNRVMDAIAVRSEVTDRQLNSLTATVERTSQNVDRAVEEMKQSAQNMERSADRVERQVGLMSEHLTAIDIKLERLIDAIGLHLKIADKQTDNIAELTKLVTALISRAA